MRVDSSGLAMQIYAITCPSLQLPHIFCASLLVSVPECMDIAVTRLLQFGVVTKASIAKEKR